MRELTLDVDRLKINRPVGMKRLYQKSQIGGQTLSKVQDGVSVGSKAAHAYPKSQYTIKNLLHEDQLGALKSCHGYGGDGCIYNYEQHDGKD